MNKFIYVVIKRIRDKYTKEVYEVGNELELTEERATEINTVNSGPYVVGPFTKPVVTEKQADEEETAEKPKRGKKKEG